MKSLRFAFTAVQLAHVSHGFGTPLSSILRSWPSPISCHTNTAGTSRSTRSATKLSSYLDGLSGSSAADYSTSAAAPSQTATCGNGSASVFEYVPILSLEMADSIANNAIACCLRNSFNPVTVYVMDASGSTIVSKRMNGCSSVGIPDFARAKAYSCVVNRYPSRAFRDRYTTTDEFGKLGQMLGMVAIADGQMAPFPGGIVLKVDDQVIGAVGVSGAAGDEDEYCAIRGVVESNYAGLTCIPKEHSCSTVKDQF